jgi:hypothetical protein
MPDWYREGVQDGVWRNGKDVISRI